MPTLPGGKLLGLMAFGLWVLSGIFIVEPDELGVVTRFGAFDRISDPGPHYHLPYPLESVQTPKVSQIRRLEVGFRSLGRADTQGQQYRLVPEESLMLTGDENIVDVQFIVQYQVKDATDYLFKVRDADRTVKDAAEAAMRSIIGDSDIDSALTMGKLVIQNSARDLLQRVLDSYESGIRVVAVQLQDVHPPKEVVDAFKDVASAREDRSRIVNEAEAYQNDLIPRTRGEAANILNQAEAFRQSTVLRAQGESSRFLALAKEYDKAKDVTRERLYLETVESILSREGTAKMVIGDQALEKLVPYLPLEGLGRGSGRLGEPQPGEIQPGEVRPGDVRPGEVRHRELRPGQARVGAESGGKR